MIMADDSGFHLDDHHRRWARNAAKRYGHGQNYYLDLIAGQRGLCAFSGARLFFDADHGRAIFGGKGCHPLYAALDHTAAGSDDAGHSIVCYALNDIKGHLPLDCFNALKSSSAWQVFMEAWLHQADENREDRAALKGLRIKRASKPVSKLNGRKKVGLLVPARMMQTGGGSTQQHSSEVDVDARTILFALVTHGNHENWFFSDPDSIRILSVEDFPEDSACTT
jgi:hypothetical protein